MKTLLKKMAAGLFLAAASVAANASVIASAYVVGGDPYFNDYDVIFGYGNPAAPIWQQQVAWDHSSGDAFDANGFATADITAQFNPAINQQWWVLVDDNWGGNSSYLVNFSITTDTDMYVSSDTPMYIPDHGHVYAFINIEAAPVPEPATLGLLGLGLAGVGIARRKKQ